MKSHNTLLFRETVHLLVGQLLCLIPLMLFFSIVRSLNAAVLLGGLTGVLIAVINYLVMALSVSAAASRAVRQDVKGGLALIQTVSLLRHGLVFLSLVLCARTERMNLLALVLPLLLTRPLIALSQSMHPKGGSEL